MTPIRRSSPRRRDVPPPSTGAGEKEVLLGFLDYLRASVAAKSEGVPEPQVRTAGVASGTNLLGLVKHLTYVERYTFLGENVTDWHATFRPEPGETADAVLTAYRDTIARANEVVDACADLTAPVTVRPHGGARPRCAGPSRT